MIKMIYRFLYITAVFAGLILPLSACNTIEGISRDIRTAGEVITGSSASRGYYSQNP